MKQLQEVEKEVYSFAATTTVVIESKGEEVRLGYGVADTEDGLLWAISDGNSIALADGIGYEELVGGVGGFAAHNSCSFGFEGGIAHSGFRTEFIADVYDYENKIRYEVFIRECSDKPAWKLLIGPTSVREYDTYEEACALLYGIAARAGWQVVSRTGITIDRAFAA